MRTESIDDIDWKSLRGQAYKTAREHPGVVQKWQAEDGYRTVVFRPGTEAVDIGLADLTIEARPGHWYERTLFDLTKMSGDTQLGFRVYEACEQDM